MKKGRTTKNMKIIILSKEEETGLYEICDCPYRMAMMLKTRKLTDEKSMDHEHRILILSGKEDEVSRLFKENGYRLDYGSCE